MCEESLIAVADVVAFGEGVGYWSTRHPFHRVVNGNGHIRKLLEHQARLTNRCQSNRVFVCLEHHRHMWTACFQRIRMACSSWMKRHYLPENIVPVWTTEMYMKRTAPRNISPLKIGRDNTADSRCASTA